MNWIGTQTALAAPSKSTRLVAGKTSDFVRMTSTAPFLSIMSKRISLIDIACNLTDPVFTGIYHGRQKHEDDFTDILHRASVNNVDKIMITGTNLTDSRAAVTLAAKHRHLFATVGCHPTRCKEFGSSEVEAESYLADLRQVMNSSNKVVAVGELGLDYDRTHFCTVDIQKAGFLRQLHLSRESQLPLFLHCRAAFDDFHEILSTNRSSFRTGVVHSFDGTAEQAARLISMGLFIGLNGCSLKTEENVAAVSKIPIDKIMLETDAPWCEVRDSHAGVTFVRDKGVILRSRNNMVSCKKEKFCKGSMVKGRNEPCNIVTVLEIVAGIKGMNKEEVADIVRRTTESVFKLDTGTEEGDDGN